MNDLTGLTAVLGSTVLLGILATLATQGLKKLSRLERDWVIHTLFVAVGIALAASQYVLQLKGHLPVEILGITSTSIIGIAGMIYKYAGYLKDLLGRIQIAPAQNVVAQAAPASATATMATLPVSTIDTTQSAPVTEL